jgi:septal ring factor EnvC (AmiA/AmiB activator)
MGILIDQVLTVALSLFAGLALEVYRQLVLPRLRQQFAPKGKKPSKSYKEQMAKLTQSLVRASSEVDHILQEMTEVSQQRETAITKLEQQLGSLSEREKELQKKIDTLEKVPLPAVEYFASVVERGEKRSAWRDYSLFGLGVIVSTVIAIVLRLFGI